MILQLMIMHLMLIVFENDDFLFEIVDFFEIVIILDKAKRFRLMSFIKINLNKDIILLHAII